MSWRGASLTTPKSPLLRSIGNMVSSGLTGLHCRAVFASKAAESAAGESEVFQRAHPVKASLGELDEFSDFVESAGRDRRF
jgi:hypothetical protein